MAFAWTRKGQELPDVKHSLRGSPSGMSRKRWGTMEFQMNHKENDPKNVRRNGTWKIMRGVRKFHRNFLPQKSNPPILPKKLVSAGGGEENQNPDLNYFFSFTGPIENLTTDTKKRGFKIYVGVWKWVWTCKDKMLDRRFWRNIF